MSTIIKREGDTTYYSGHPKVRELEAQEEAKLAEAIGLAEELASYRAQKNLNHIQLRLVEWIEKRLAELGA